MFFFQISRLRQIGQELFHLRQSNRHTKPVPSDSAPVEIARLNQGHNHVLKQSDDLNVTRLSPARNYNGKQDQNAVQQIVCDDEVMFKTTDNRNLAVWYVQQCCIGHGGAYLRSCHSMQ